MTTEARPGPADILDRDPASPYQEAKRRIAAAIKGAASEILELSHRIHENPEPAFEERQASEWLSTALAAHGFSVEYPAGQLKTAIRARVTGRATGRRVAILAEYDALPGLGHACGHNTMAASGLGAAIGLAAVMTDIPGEIVFLGTPAEERGSGKQFMIDDGLFEGIDAALLFHPSDRTAIEAQLLAMEDVDVTYHGRASHAASEPWEGRNALDALILLFSSIGLWRQQLRPDARVHGIIVDGGSAPNIIPERTSARFMIRSPDQAYYESMRPVFRALCEAAALATGCAVDVAFSGRSDTMRHNAVLGERYRASLEPYGVKEDAALSDLVSSDMGNVSRVVPAIHPFLAIADRGTALHSIEFRQAARAARADEVTLIAAAVAAEVGYEVLVDAELSQRGWEEFRGAGKPA
jgi:amidohydrolase